MKPFFISRFPENLPLRNWKACLKASSLQISISSSWRKKPVPEDLLGFNPAYDVIGDIALLEDENLDAQTALKIADALLRTQPNIKSVVRPLTPVIGEFRIREFEVIAGEPRTETIHREYGCRYKVDLARLISLLAFLLSAQESFPGLKMVILLSICLPE